MQVIGPPVHLIQGAPEIATNIRKHLAKEIANACSNGTSSIFGNKDQMIIQAVDDTSS